uniref:Uncharacterized protein n=1 Tax=Cyprinus carpio TaxID=7962 RepID=A0A8C1ARI0_CYPCA
MMDVETSYTEFINCDRTGRRNAVPDIQGEAVAKGTSELTKDMAQMDLKAREMLLDLLPLKQRHLGARINRGQRDRHKDQE